MTPGAKSMYRQGDCYLDENKIKKVRHITVYITVKCNLGLR